MSDDDPLGVRELQRALADADMEVAMEGVMEASQLGWLPGEWPLRFTRDGVDYVRVRPVRNAADGELVAMIYRGPDGKEVEVLND